MENNRKIEFVVFFLKFVYDLIEIFILELVENEVKVEEICLGRKDFNKIVKVYMISFCEFLSYLCLLFYYVIGKCVKG